MSTCCKKSFKKQETRKSKFATLKGSSKNHVTGVEGNGAGSRKKLVSRATLKGFMRGMHGHDGHRGMGGSVRFFADFPVTWFLDDP